MSARPVSTLRALIWDVDGTIAETERDGHRVAFNAAFEAIGLPWRWDVAHYGHLLRVAGGYERLLADLAERAEAPRDEAGRQALARELHRHKNAAYTTLVGQGGMAARPGVQRLVQECQEAGVALALATTTGRANVEALFPGLFGVHWRALFPVRICAEEAPVKKPDPLAYRLALQGLGVSLGLGLGLAPGQALALEDSPNGLLAASAAGVSTVVTRSVYFADEDFDGALAVLDNLDSAPAAVGGGRVDLAVLRRWHAGERPVPGR